MVQGWDSRAVHKSAHQQKWLWLTKSDTAAEIYERYLYNHCIGSKYYYIMFHFFTKCVKRTTLKKSNYMVFSPHILLSTNSHHIIYSHVLSYSYIVNLRKQEKEVRRNLKKKKENGEKWKMAGINDRTGVGNPLCGWLCVCWKAKEKKGGKSRTLRTSHDKSAHLLSWHEGFFISIQRPVGVNMSVSKIAIYFLLLCSSRKTCDINCYNVVHFLMHVYVYK